MSHLPGPLNSIADALSRNNLPLFFTLAPQVDPQLTPIPHHLTETSTTISSCYYPEPWPYLLQPIMPLVCQALPGFLPHLQTNRSLRHKRSYSTVCGPPQPVPALQNHTGVPSSSIIPSPLPGVQEPCLKESNAETCHPGCSTPPGAHPPQAHDCP